MPLLTGGFLFLRNNYDTGYGACGIFVVQRTPSERRNHFIVPGYIASLLTGK